MIDGFGFDSEIISFDRDYTQSRSVSMLYVCSMQSHNIANITFEIHINAAGIILPQLSHFCMFGSDALSLSTAVPELSAVPFELAIFCSQSLSLMS